MPRHDLRAFLDESFELLSREAPRTYSRLCQALTDLDLCIVDGDRRFAVRGDACAIASSELRGDEHVITIIDRPTILALVDGLLTLEDAVRQDRLFVRASPARAARAFDALSIYLRGAVRCPSFPALLAEFRSRTPPEHQPWH